MPAFLKHPWSNTRGTLCVIWENNLETFEKLFPIIQSGCSIYSHFLKPLHWNIHELWHQAIIVIKFTLYNSQSNWTLNLLFSKFSWLLGYISLNLFLFSPIFLKFFHNLMIYNTRNRSSDTTETQKEKKSLF